MAQFENKSFSVHMGRSDQPDLQKRWEDTFGKRPGSTEQLPAPVAAALIVPARDLIRLYELLSEQTRYGGALERDQLHVALDVIWRRLSQAEKDAIQR